MADAILKTAMALVHSQIITPVAAASTPCNFLQFPPLRSISPLRIMAPNILFHFPVLRSVSKRDVRVDAKKNTGQVWLVSSASTGYFYTKRRSSKKLKEKLELRKYDPRMKRHVVFSSALIKSSANKKKKQRTKRKSRSQR